VLIIADLLKRLLDVIKFTSRIPCQAMPPMSFCPPGGHTQQQRQREREEQEQWQL
jgi:hypothetical protein